MTEQEFVVCAERAFDLVQQEVMPTMGKASPQECATICKALVPELKKGAASPDVTALPPERQRNVLIRAGTILIRRLIERAT